MNINSDKTVLRLSFERSRQLIPAYASNAQYCEVKKAWEELENVCLAQAKSEGIEFSFIYSDIPNASLAQKYGGTEFLYVDIQVPHASSDRPEARVRRFTLESLPDDWMGRQIDDSRSAHSYKINKPEVIDAAKDAVIHHYLGVIHNNLNHFISMEDCLYNPAKGRILTHAAQNGFAENQDNANALTKALRVIETFRPIASNSRNYTRHIMGSAACSWRMA